MERESGDKKKSCSASEPSDGPLPCKTLFISNLHPSWQTEVDSLFRSVTGFRRMAIGPTGLYAFAEFEDVETARAAIATYDRSQIGPLFLRMNFAKKELV